MKDVSELINLFIDKQQLDSSKSYSSFFRSWSSIVGEDLAAHSKVADILNGKLIIEVDHPGWMQMISMKKNSIMYKIRKKYSELGIKDLRIILRNGDSRDIVKQNFDINSKKVDKPKQSVPKKTTSDLSEIKDEKFKNLLEKLKTSIDDYNID